MSPRVTAMLLMMRTMMRAMPMTRPAVTRIQAPNRTRAAMLTAAIMRAVLRVFGSMLLLLLVFLYFVFDCVGA